MGKLKYLFALAVGAAVAYFERYAALYVFVCAAILLDLITGMLAAVMEGVGLSSEIARKGFLKKLVLLVAVAFGTFLDVLMPFAAAKVGIHYGGLIFSSVIGVYICVTECVSVTENLYRCSPRILPARVVRLLKDFKEKMEKNEEENHG